MKTKLLILGLILQAPLAFARPHSLHKVEKSDKNKAKVEQVASDSLLVAKADSVLEAKADSLDAEVALPADLRLPKPYTPNAIDSAEALTPETRKINFLKEPLRSED